MTERSDRWRRVEELCHAALERSENERAFGAVIGTPLDWFDRYLGPIGNGPRTGQSR